MAKYVGKPIAVESFRPTVSQACALVIDDLAGIQIYMVRPIIIVLDEQRPRVVRFLRDVDDRTNNMCLGPVAVHF